MRGQFLLEDITKQDICELFGLHSTSCLQDTCNIDFPKNNRTREFVFTRAPAHIIDEPIKLHGIAYHDNEFQG